MTKFNVGDVVKVVESPFTDERLEDNVVPVCEWLGKELTVKGYINDDTPLLDDGMDLIWDDNWLELVEDSENGEGV